MSFELLAVVIRFLVFISFTSSSELFLAEAQEEQCSRSEQWVGIRGIEPKRFHHICLTERSVSD